MSFRTKLDALPSEKWRNDRVCFKKIKSQDDLIYAIFDCNLRDDQIDLVNPAGFSIGRAYLNPDNNYPCIICNSDGKNIGFINLLKWLGTGNALSWSYFIDRDEQGKGYGKKAAELAIEILESIADGEMIKVSTEQSNVYAQRLYLSVGLQKLDELDGDDFVFGR